jgi:DegV family protein with EDD domain
VTGRRVGLVVDSGASLDEKLGQGLAVAPYHVVVGDAPLENGSDDELYARLRRGERATTSTPSPGDYLGAFERLGPGLEAIVCLTIPARWSGTHASALLASRMFAEDHPAPVIEVIETPTAAAGYGLVARLAAALCGTGADCRTVRARVIEAAEDVRMYGALATLEYVARSGRVPTLVAGVSDALHMRPVFEMKAGGTGRVALARTDAGVLRALERIAQERLDAGVPHRLILFHAAAPELAAELGERIAAAARIEHADTVALAPVIGVHIGPGAVGFAALPVRPDDPPAHTP